ncbi:hypothetical protein [Solwaraspora sp. WMMA2065]|uniref:hypothetical protein n=1 Tax=Solwaraspora sp. WMMA2065 TaxID=3015166 RepID=UPI00259BBCEA|nr:hypothetical protein [Solwaraspora sp. WMMA2065]WJK35287.1 hypothetical protein O7610_02560 [Solwaraspora sp. WMMA2065]
MRTVYTSADPDTFHHARQRLVGRVGKWARRQRRTELDPFVIETLLEYRWSHGDGLLGRWHPDDLTAALLDGFPRHVTMHPDDWDAVVPSVRGFVDFLFDEGFADRHCADRDLLHTTLDELAGPVAEALADERRYGPAKYWTTRMMREGVDPTDNAAAQAFIADVHAGRISVDQDLLNQIMANHRAASDGAQRPPTLPLVTVPDDAELRPAAEASTILHRVRQFVAWVGPGRTLTPNGNLRLADARELVPLLDTADVIDPAIGDRVFKTRSSEELYGLSVVVAWARAARVVRMVKGRLVPVKSAAKLLTDPLALAHRLYATLPEIGAAVCGSGWRESLMRWRFDDAVVITALTIYSSAEPLPVPALRELLHQALEKSMLVPYGGTEEQQQAWRQSAHNDADRLFAQLADLGAVRLTDDDRISLTPLGAMLVGHHLREQGVVVPTVADLLDETAEVVVAVAADSDPDSAARLLTAWCAHQPQSGPAELRALARRTDDQKHRRLARSHTG